jgi:TatD DNase family protein
MPPILSYIDTHTHLDHHGELTPSEQVERAAVAGVATLITVGTDIASSQASIDAAEAFDGVWAVVGIHPNDAEQATPAALAQLDLMAQHPRVIGIGETGLDFYREWCDHEVQHQSFRDHIDLARRHDLTLVIHCRDAWDATLQVLAEHGAPDRVVMHCFSGNADIAARCAENGWFMSFAGNVTFKNAQMLRDAAAVAPLELLLTETDSPYLTPEPHRGTRNDSSNIPLVVAQLAQTLDLTPSQVAGAIMANAHRAFGLGAPAIAGAVPTKATT